MSSLNRSQMLRDVLHYRRPNHRDLSPNATTGKWSVEKEIQRFKRQDASPASATSSRSTSPTPPRVLRRPNIIVEDDRGYSRASALSLENLLATRSSRAFSSSAALSQKASLAHDK